MGSMNSVFRISPGCTANTFLDLAMITPFLVVVHDFYVESVSVPPYETHTVLIVDADAVLSGAAPAKRLELIARRHLQVLKPDGGIQNSEFLKRSSVEIGGKPAAFARSPEPLRLLVPETRDHFLIY